ncbi:UNVERIFIED_CONTAM: hypothetical protein HDU68_008883 [Siphonaria sp. JEL0065]|nr:hypothetical protein HDU68_008883 [Siphonaria sp. JEL0065]
MSSNNKITISETPDSRPSKFGTPTKKTGNTIRSSIDLELQLGFEKNPLDKPSSDFRDAESWFSQAKQTAETAAVEETDKVARPEQASRKSFPAWGTGRSSRHIDEHQQHQDDTYFPPPATDRSSFFRSSFFGGVPRPTLEHTAPLPPDRAATKRPMGPRQLNGGTGRTATPDDYQLRSMKSIQSVSARSQNDSLKDMYDSDPADMLSTPLWYFQLRVWINGIILLCSIIAAAIMTSVSGQPVAPSTLSSRFWIATSLFSILISLVQVIFYYTKGSKMLYHYDTPFLLITSSTSASGLTKGLTKKDLYLPATDMIAHSLIVIFWIGTLSDVGMGIGSCRAATLSANVSTNICTGLEAAVSFGVATIVGFVFTTGMKSWELYSNMGLIRKAV